MKRKGRGLQSISYRKLWSTALFLCSLFAIPYSPVYGQGPATTTVQDTVYKSDGSLASGSVVITWAPFNSADSKPVFGGTKTVPLNAGALQVALVPNAGATPAGTSYTVKYYQSGSVYSEETWVVPSSSTPVTLFQVRVSSSSSSNTTISASQVIGTAVVQSPTATQIITAPPSSGVVPLRLKGNATANTSILEIYDSQATPALQGRFDATGALILAKAPSFSSVTQGSLLFAGTGGLLSQDNADLFWNASTPGLFVGPRTALNLSTDAYTLFLGSHGGTPTNSYGLFVQDQSGIGTNNWNIWSGTPLASTTDIGDGGWPLNNSANVFASSGDGTQSLVSWTESTGVGASVEAMEIMTNGLGVTSAASVSGEFGAVQQGAGTTTLLAAVNGWLQANHGVITDAIALHAATPSVGAGGTVTNTYGLKIENQIGGGTGNYAIKTGTGLVQFGDKVLSPNIENIRFADQFPGADCGAKINAAEADLSSSPGEIWVNQNCGTSWTTAVTISHDNHILHIIQGGTYNISQLLTFSGHNGALICDNYGDTNAAGTLLQEAAGANLPVFINVTGYGFRIENCYIGGNKSNNPAGQDGIKVDAQKFTMSRGTRVLNFPRHGVVLTSNSQETVIDGNISVNGVSGIEMQNGATDIFLRPISLNNNGAWNIHGEGVGGLHLWGGDLSNLATTLPTWTQNTTYAPGTYIIDSNGNVQFTLAGGVGKSNPHPAWNATLRGTTTDNTVTWVTMGQPEPILLDGTNNAVDFPLIQGVHISPCYGNCIHLEHANGFSIADNFIATLNGSYDGIKVDYYGPGKINDNIVLTSGGNGLHCIEITGATQPSSISANHCFSDTAGFGIVASHFDTISEDNTVALANTDATCTSSASPAVCNGDRTGRFVIAAGQTSVSVNTTAVSANSEIKLTRDDSLGTVLGVTCNTQSSLVLGTPRVTARTAGASFTVSIDVVPASNPLCLSYTITN